MNSVIILIEPSLVPCFNPVAYFGKLLISPMKLSWNSVYRGTLRSTRASQKIMHKIADEIIILYIILVLPLDVQCR